jgi:hypothetical protein
VQTTVTFTLLNGYEPQLPPSVSIRAVGEVTFPAGAVTSVTVEDSQPLYIVGFSTRIAEQSTPSASADNTITVSFAFNRRMPLDSAVGVPYSNPIITISGLTNSLSPTILLLNDQAGFAYDATWRTDGSAAPQWDQETGTLVLRPKQDIPKLYTFTVNIRLQNPPLGQDARNVTISLTTDVSIYINDALVKMQTITGFSAQLMRNAPGIAAPLLILDFLQARIGQGAGTPSTDKTNTLTVTLSNRGALVTTAVLTISGLLRAIATIGSLALADASGDASCGLAASCHLFFARAAGGTGGFGLWTGNATLLLYVTKSVPAGSTLQFSFQVKNPSVGQFPPSVSIQSNGPNAVVTAVAMFSDAGNRAPLAVAGFNASSIRQTDQSQGALNSIIVTLQPFTTLLAGTAITLTNLQGASRDPVVGTQLSLVPGCGTPCPFSASDSAGGTEGFGYWQQQGPTGLLAFYLLTPLSAAQVYTFSFQVRNAADGQHAPPISIEASGTDSIVTRIPILSPRGAFEALRIAGFITTFVFQSKAIAAVVNNITLTFSAYNVFTSQPPSFVTMTGLVSTVSTLESDTIRSIQNAYALSDGIFNAVIDSRTFVLNFSKTADSNATGNYSGQYLVVGGELSQIVSYSKINGTITAQVLPPFSSQITTKTTFQIATYPNYVFNSTGTWDLKGGQLIVPVIADTAIGVNYSFYFQVKNPDVTQDALPVSLGSSEIYVSTIRMQAAVGLLAPLYIGG